MVTVLGAVEGIWPPAAPCLQAASSAPRSVAFGPFAIRVFTGHSNYAHALAGSNPSCFRMKTKRHPKWMSFCFVSTVRLGCLLGIPAFLNRELNSQLMFLLNKLKDFHFNLSEKPEHINVFDFIALADIWNFYSSFTLSIKTTFPSIFSRNCLQKPGIMSNG